MKKSTKRIIIITAAGIATLLLITFWILRSNSGFKSIYFVPENAFVIIESKDPLKAWEGIVQSEMWNYYKNHKSFEELNKDIQTYDSVVRSNKILWKLIGEKSITISLHGRSSNNFDMLFIIDVGKIGNISNTEKIIRTTLGEDYEVTSRKYNNIHITEILDTKEQAHYFLTLYKGKLVFSLNPQLLEQAIDATETKSIGRDLNFLNVSAKNAHRGLFELYVNFNEVVPIINALDPESAEAFKHNTRYIQYLGFIFNIEDNVLSINGHTSLSDTTPDEYLATLKSSGKELSAGHVIPQRIASLTKINFKDAEDLVYCSIKSIGKEEFNDFIKNKEYLEKKLKISLKENLFDWIGEEIIFLQTQPSNLGHDNEFALIIQAKDSADADKNLNIIWKNIKKNTPVKIKTADYKNYEIKFISFPQIIKVLFSNTLEKLEKPYITQIGEYVIFSNHPQTVKNIIDDYISGKTLSKTNNYKEFTKNLKKRTSVEIYAEPPVLFQNLKAFVNAETWNNLNENKKYITCFNQAGIQISKEDNLMVFSFNASFKPEHQNIEKQYYNTNEIFSLFKTGEKIKEMTEDSIPEIILDNLDSKKHKEFYDNGEIKLTVDVKDGKKDGTIKMYYPSGKIQIKGQFEDDEPSGKWKFYDEEGDIIKTEIYKN